MEKVTSEVPQGNVLEPVLSNLYINDLPDQMKAKYTMFTDDVKIYEDPIPRPSNYHCDVSALEPGMSQQELIGRVTSQAHGVVVITIPECVISWLIRSLKGNSESLFHDHSANRFPFKSFK